MYVCTSFTNFTYVFRFYLWNLLFKATGFWQLSLHLSRQGVVSGQKHVQLRYLRSPFGRLRPFEVGFYLCSKKRGSFEVAAAAAAAKQLTFKYREVKPYQFYFLLLLSIVLLHFSLCSYFPFLW